MDVRSTMMSTCHPLSCAIAGDIVGSRFEFAPHKSKDFELITEKSRFTDDTVLTIAVADACIEAVPLQEERSNWRNQDSDAETLFKETLARKLLTWARRYPYAGYGGMFQKQVESGRIIPYNSFGNGSAMRISAVGWLFDDLPLTEKYARWSAEVTHNHPEGIKGSQSVAAAIFLARTGSSKSDIAAYVAHSFGYDLERTLAEIRPAYRFEVSCQKSVPEAIISFLESESFEDALRNAVSLGGDADTQACIAGAIAGAFYGGSTSVFEQQVLARLDREMKQAIERFRTFLSAHRCMDKLSEA